MAFFLLNANKNFTENLSNNILNIKNKVHYCKSCHALTDMSREICNICDSTTRNKSTIAVVEEYLDMITLEES
ncbi:MAG: hypothetical protein Q8S84_05830 [bacterium]|nr:hypothetical protein [bacterium]MDP3381000.1 hypothetical protein [bacterium]